MQNNNNNNADKFKEEFTVIKLTHTHTAFQEAFREDFVNIQTSSETISYNHSILEMEGEIIFIFVDSNWDLKAVVLIQVSYDQYTELQELQSFRGTKIQNTVKVNRKPFSPTESRFRHFLRSCNG